METCAECGAKAKMQCTGCRVVQYCSPECQQIHWKVHKKMCKSKAHTEKPESSLATLANGRWPLSGQRFLQRMQTRRQKQAPVVGLQNQGNTCYLNAILQCIVHTPFLHEFLTELNEEWLQKQDARWLLELRQLLRDMSEAEERGMVSGSGIARLITVNKEFVQGQQADAHEAFIFVVERLLEACLSVHSDEKNPLMEAARRSPAAKEALERNSLLGLFFGMDLGQAVTCKTCDYVSERCHAEYCICLRAAMGLEDRRSMSGYGMPDTTLDELFEAYARVEQIEGYKCERCSSRAGCEQSTYIKRKPNILVVYISRQKDTNRFGKINRSVEFPESFDLSPFLEKASVARYRLFGVVVHRDVNRSTFFGHYVAYVRLSGGWMEMDDARVSRVSWNLVKDQQVDLLFYAAETVEPPLPPWEANAPTKDQNGHSRHEMPAAPASRISEPQVPQRPAQPVPQSEARPTPSDPPANRPVGRGSEAIPTSSGIFDFDALDALED